MKLYKLRGYKQSAQHIKRRVKSRKISGWWSNPEETKKKISKTNSNPKQKVVHHIDGNHNNNSPDNLMVMRRDEHSYLHYLQGDLIRKPKWA